MTIRGASLIAAAVLVAGPMAAPAADFGLSLGLSRAIQDFECQEPYEYDTGYVLGPRFGLFAEFQVTPWLAVSAEVAYAHMGMSYEWEIYTVDNRLHYIAIPVMARAQLHSYGASPYLSVGPRVDVLVARSPDPWFESMYDDLAGVGLGADIALGIDTGFSSWEFRYSISFTDSHPDEPLFDITNRAYSFIVGLTFKGGHDTSD